MNKGVVATHTKSVGSSLVARPTFRGSGIACMSKRDNAEAHALVYK